MKKRNVLSFLLILCLLTSSLAACAGPSDIELPVGHRYGNPEITYGDGEICIKYICVDCDFTELETRTVSTQVNDTIAWDEAFKNLDMTKYGLSLGTTNGDKVDTKHCIVSENKGYYASVAPDGTTFLEVCYTLQKEDGTFVTYLRSEEETVLAPETDSSYFDRIKKESGLHLSFEGMFDQFTYDAESGSYINNEPVSVELRGASGESLGVKALQNVTVNIVDGKICRIKADYSEVNEYLEEVRIDLCFYNVGFAVMKVPQSIINEVAGSNGSIDPDEYHKYFTFEIKNGEVTLKSVDTAISGNITIPSAVGNFPVVAIGENAFLNCSNLTGVTIPGSVASIGDNAFLGCDSLVKVAYAGTQADWEKITITGTGNEVLLDATVQFNNECAHSYGDGVVTKQPTCGAAGVKTYTCTLCGSEKTEIITEALSHSYDSGVITEEPTCTDAGIKTYTCTVCGKNKTEYIPKLTSHNYTNGTCIHCGADDPKYVGDTGEEDGGIWGAIVNLIKSFFEIVAFLK